ncbi:uncharacterized protein KD926_005888 [Aspergillus affinis]|uniref:uncharacterized protein n=1 Tax=Aspergillus affinis TaxID=1070780 RepID=UPI0022FF1BB0|nr:uncharacterized protein KD926_005888 [Aspergillus affinis]KAI9045944.1 hypothetical protein KD926_005888 [Aspergillus affinis]
MLPLLCFLSSSGLSTALPAHFRLFPFGSLLQNPDDRGRLYDPGYMCPIGTQWYPPSHDDIEPDCSIFDVYQWTHNHIKKDDAVKGTLLTSEKQAIMDALDGWCLYKDWDSLTGALPERALRCMTDLIARALVVKDIIETITKNPFFYMDLGDDVSGRADALPPPLGLELYHLWQKLLKVDRVDAHKWREQTVHLMNKALPHQRPKDTFAGVRSLRLRRRITRHLATKMLDRSSPLYPLLRKNVGTQTKLARFKLMLGIYRDAAEKSVKMWIGLYNETSEFYHMEWQTWQTFSDDNPNSRRTVLILAPLIWQLQFGIEPTPREELDGCSPTPVDEDGHPNVIVCRGLVVLSKHTESEPTEEA